jgi:hypothetical protein
LTHSPSLSFTHTHNSASTAATTAADALSRAAASLDATLHLRARAAAASAATAAAAREADEKFGLTAKGRRVAEDAARAAPRYLSRVRAFLSGPGGPPTFAAVVIGLAWVGWLGRILNFLVLLWWAAPLLGLPVAAAAARARAAEAEAAQARARARANPFAGWPGFGGGGGQAGGRSKAPPKGDVIDVEYDILDGRP